jgi:hypothetical protein
MLDVALGLLAAAGIGLRRWRHRRGIPEIIYMSCCYIGNRLQKINEDVIARKRNSKGAEQGRETSVERRKKQQRDAEVYKKMC